MDGPPRCVAMMRGWKRWSVLWAVGAGLVGCGDSGPKTYDVTLDAAALGDATRVCSTTGTSQVGAVDIPAQQRWTIRESGFGGSVLQVPDIHYTLEGSLIELDEEDTEPDAIEGTTFDQGPYEYVLFNTYVQPEPRGTFYQALRYTIADTELGDSISGFIWFRNELAGDPNTTFPDKECTLTFPLTGRRVED